MKAPILRKETLAPGISRMVLSAPEVAAHAAAGQFIIHRPTENGERIPLTICLLYTSPSPRDVEESRMPSSA